MTAGIMKFWGMSEEPVATTPTTWEVAGITGYQRSYGN